MADESEPQVPQARKGSGRAVQNLCKRESSDDSGASEGREGREGREGSEGRESRESSEGSEGSEGSGEGDGCDCSSGGDRYSTASKG